VTKPPSPSVVLAHYAKALRAAAPREWEAFIQCFDAYATEVTVAVTQAEQHEVLQKQGQARAFLHLLNLYRTCHQTPKPPPSA
jgi:hypothetical protein